MTVDRAALPVPVSGVPGYQDIRLAVENRIAVLTLFLVVFGVLTLSAPCGMTVPFQVNLSPFVGSFASFCIAAPIYARPVLEPNAIRPSGKGRR